MTEIMTKEECYVKGEESNLNRDLRTQRNKKTKDPSPPINAKVTTIPNQGHGDYHTPWES